MVKNQKKARMVRIIKWQAVKVEFKGAGRV